MRACVEVEDTADHAEEHYPVRRRLNIDEAKLRMSAMKQPSVGSPTNGIAEGRDDAAHVAQPGRDLTAVDAELLRCAGLDTFLLIRLARFGFDVTCYPFLFSCVAILPIYWTSPNKAGAVDDGYLSTTINRVEDGSYKLVLIMVFQAFLYTYILRRLWIEWEVSYHRNSQVLGFHLFS